MKQLLRLKKLYKFTFCILFSPVDNIPPVIRGCPDDIIDTGILNGENTQVATVTWIEPVATDNSGGIVTVDSTYAPGDTFPVGVTNVRYTFTDPYGNSNFCRFTITVTGEEGLFYQKFTRPM